MLERNERSRSTRARRARRRHERLASGVALAIATALAACGGGQGGATGSAAPELSESCQKYLVAYSACARGTVPDHPEIAAARVESARESLLRQTDVKGRDALCSSGAAKLRSACL